MKRINGYIDLENFFEEENFNQDEIRSRYSDIKKGNFKFSFEIEKDINVIFKTCDGEEFKELIVEEIFKYLQIPVAHYDLAVLHGIKGAITYDFRKENAKYISGEEILEDYYSFVYDNDRLKDDFNLSKDFENKTIYSEDGTIFDLSEDFKSEIFKNKTTYSEEGTIFNLENLGNLKAFNSLEIIWAALDYHFYNWDNKEEIVSDIMKSLVTKRNLDILLCGSDSHANNWMIEEDDEGARLAPLYDNSKTFYEDPIMLLNTNFYTDGLDTSLENDLEDYLKTASTEDINDLIELYNKLNIDVLNECIEKAKRRTNHIPNESNINKIKNIFNMNQTIVGNILSEYVSKYK